ncbi:MAG TPA: carbohydrate-binding protein, partial [Herpetosiphonaceae bacterium]|nr:carbohydrate-binding protein [Herpetosiphonaceae bacterium]
MQRIVSIIALLGIFAVLFALPAGAAPAAWTPGTTYQAGAQVTYNGLVYECLQGHTAQVGWEPPNVPALWKAGGSVPATATIPPRTPSDPTWPPITMTMPPASPTAKPPTTQ